MGLVKRGMKERGGGNERGRNRHRRLSFALSCCECVSSFSRRVTPRSIVLAGIPENEKRGKFIDTFNWISGKWNAF